MSKIKAVIFDFDGTIADTGNAVISILSRLAGRKNLRTRKEEFRNKTADEVLKEYDIPKAKLLWFSRRVREELNKKIAQIRPSRRFRKD